MTLTIPTPPGFRYRPTLYSHGWCALAPFAFDEANFTLTRLQQVDGGRVVRLTINAADDRALQVRVEGLPDEPTADGADEVKRVVARIFGFDQSLDEFYALARRMPAYAWVERAGAGRMLVSPTVWEDLAKTLLTTNTTWRMTKDMVSRLVTLGSPYAGGGHAFPTPAQVAALAPDALNAHARAGYRGAYLHELALQIAEGRLDPEAWRDPALPADEVYRRLKGIKGFGDYAGGAMMRLLGRFDELGLDSVCRTMFKDRWNGGSAATDRDISAHYAPFGKWRGLAVWMDVMREDFDTPDGIA